MIVTFFVASSAELIHRISYTVLLLVIVGRCRFSLLLFFGKIVNSTRYHESSRSL